jgi:hypothetical protein
VSAWPPALYPFAHHAQAKSTSPSRRDIPLFRDKPIPDIALEVVKTHGSLDKLRR